MNQEKEVLLSLLLEKYNNNKTIAQPVATHTRIRRKATRYNIYRAAVYQVPWSNQEHDAMVTFYKQGKSFSEIAQILGRSKGAVEIRCRKTIMRQMQDNNNA